MQYEASVTVYIGRAANKNIYQNGYHFKNLYIRMTKKSNHYIFKVYVHIHIKDEVSMNIYMDRRAYKRKVPKWQCHLTTIS